MSTPILTVELDPGCVQACTQLLLPYLPHHSALPSVMPAGERKAIVLHPRITSPKDVPKETAQEVATLGGHWVQQTAELTERERGELFTVQFMSRSKNTPPLAPGLPDHWRSYLSNFATAIKLRIEGGDYASIEHYFQAAKAKCSTRPEMARWFCVDYDGAEKVGDDPRVAKQAGSRKHYQSRGAELNVEQWLEHREPAMQFALSARWKQDELFRRILISTRGLRLLHMERAGARSFWGGALDKQTGRIKGENRLGQMMEMLRK